MRVRMALHMGAAEERGGDYFGPPVNRVARLLSAAHGGQVLLSLPTHEMVRDQLPVGMSLTDLVLFHTMNARGTGVSASGEHPPP